MPKRKEKIPKVYELINTYMEVSAEESARLKEEIRNDVIRCIMTRYANGTLFKTDRDKAV